MNETAPPVERLAAILAADVAGYSRLMRADERRTVAMLDEYRTVFQAAIDRHNGRVVDMAGDSVLAVFDSVGAAATAAIEVQTELALRNGAHPDDQKMAFRIGINLGDILEKPDGSIYGDGVNVAARLESLANPGGINVSGSVFNSIRAKVPASFEFIGEQDLKNIANPVAVYRLVQDALPEAVVADAPAVKSPLESDDLPGVTIMPLKVISGDEEIESLAAGLYQDILGGLTRQTAITVHSGGDATHSDFRLEGNIRAAGERLRLSFDLVDTGSDKQVWSERYDRQMQDIFDLEDEISFNVASTVRIRIKARTFEKLRETSDADLSIGNLLSKAAGYFVTSCGHNDQAAASLDAVLEREPNNAMANAMMVFCQYRRWEYSPLMPPPAWSAEMTRQITAALSADPASYFAHLIAAVVQQDLIGDFVAARVHVETALEINPGFSPATGTLGVIEIQCGDRERGFEILRHALEAAPEDPHRYRHYRELAIGNFLAGNLAASVKVIERLLRQAPELARNRLTAATLLAADGRQSEAEETIRVLRGEFPDLSAASARVHQFADPTEAKRFNLALSETGIPA